MSKIFIFFFFNFLFVYQTFAQDKKIIEIQKAGSSNQNEKLYPGGNILLKDSDTRVHLFHDGALVISDKAFFYNKKNFFEAEGDVVFTQGDTLKMTCSKLEYNGNSKKAKAWGNVVLDKPDMSLKTDTLYLDRNKNIGFYKNFAKIIDSSNILTSKKGTFFMNENKYRFTSSVNIENPNYKLKSERLDYFTDNDKAFFYGPSNIYGKDYKVFSERGSYDLKIEKGYFKKNGKINYDGKIIYGDSLYFDKNKDYASATNRVKLVDTINNSIIYGHYGEIYKSKDSAIITKRALSMYIVENDSLFIHADTLVVTGEEKNRILRGYYDVRIFKSNIRGKSDSIYFEENTGNIELIKKPLNNKEVQIFSEEEKNLRNPVLWFGESQMTGDKIFLLSELKNKKLDSLKIIGNAFIVEKDSIDNNGFNQIKGGILNGNFVDGNLKNIEVVKNTQVIYYLYSDENELIGIDKTLCSSLDMIMENNEISDIKFNVKPDGEVFPDKEIDINERKFKGFIWRINEKPINKNDLFSETDNKIILPVINEIEMPKSFYSDLDFNK